MDILKDFLGTLNRNFISREDAILYLNKAFDIKEFTDEKKKEIKEHYNSKSKLSIADKDSDTSIE
ncbi:MAG: hypothetical protein IPJ13_02245 [Saprospiraceae bacterium]|nr:hypothetical protein [Saprospiraceae bacterium]MBK9737712.1 hypothetical protein [Saprospiraceae bacterium]